MFQTKVVQKIKTHIIVQLRFFYENSAVCGIILKNIVGPDRPQITIWRMRIVWWIPNAKNTY